VAVLGEMRELGESSEAEHEEVGRLAVRLGVRHVVAVGEPAHGVQRGAARELAGGTAPDERDDERKEAAFVEDNDAAVAWLRARVRPGDVVLVKASRGARLDVVAEALLAGDARDTADAQDGDRPAAGAAS
jgi:UDP-N-acetylmuramoyl-tripeptide--D-alanyl-D-alanine ligase